MFMSFGVKIIHSQGYADMIAKTFKTAKDSNAIVDFVGNTLVDLILRIESAADEKGKKIDPTVIINAGNQLMAEILVIGEAVGAKPMSEDEKAQAFSLATSKYMDNAVKTGRYTSEEIQAAAAEAQKTPEGQKIGQEYQKSFGGKPQAQPQGQAPVPGKAPVPARPMPPQRQPMPRQQPPQQPGGLLAPRGR
jgi:hypothetical protein